MTAVLELPPVLVTTPSAAPVTGRRDRAGRAWLASVFLVYGALGWCTTVLAHAMPGDAASRVNNGVGAVLGRDPHLAAVGFVWNPLPALASCPLLLLHGLYAPLLTDGFAGAIVSSAAMAVAVRLVRSLLGELGLHGRARELLTLAFALQPMIVWYAANGMSEAWLLLATAWCARELVRWCRSGSSSHLFLAGLAMAVGYLARYEAAAGGLAVVAFVAAVTWRRTRSLTLTRLDALLVGSPVALSFAVWAVASKVVVGSWFVQLSSRYGNSTQLVQGDVSASTVSGHEGPLAYVSTQLFILTPGLLVVGVWLAVLAWRSRRVELLALPAIAGAILGFEVLGFLAGETYGWLRFYILAIPLTVVAAGAVLAASRRRLTGVLVATLVLPAFATQVAFATDAHHAREEAAEVEVVTAALEGGRSWVDGSADEQLARRLTAMHLPDGAVLVDAAHGFRVILDSDRPKLFVVTPDRDFERKVADPAVFGVRYLIDVAPTGTGASDAVNLAWPTLWDTGAGIADLVATFDDHRPGSTAYRLFQVRPLAETG